MEKRENMSSDIRKLGVVVVKVFVTGLQPMYFGSNYEILYDVTVTWIL